MDTVKNLVSRFWSVVKEVAASLCVIGLVVLSSVASVVMAMLRSVVDTVKAVYACGYDVMTTGWFVGECLFDEDVVVADVLTAGRIETVDKLYCHYMAWSVRRVCEAKELWAVSINGAMLAIVLQAAPAMIAVDSGVEAVKAYSREVWDKTVQFKGRCVEVYAFNKARVQYLFAKKARGLDEQMDNVLLLALD